MEVTQNVLCVSWGGKGRIHKMKNKNEILGSCEHPFRSMRVKFSWEFLRKNRRGWGGQGRPCWGRKGGGKEDGVDAPVWAFAMSAFRSWQADSVDSGCSSCAQTSPPHPEPCCVGADPIRGHTFAGQADPYSPEKFQPPPLKVSGRG